jgi:hypothetical protein
VPWVPGKILSIPGSWRDLSPVCGQKAIFCSRRLEPAPLEGENSMSPFGCNSV